MMCKIHLCINVVSDTSIQLSVFLKALTKGVKQVFCWRLLDFFSLLRKAEKKCERMIWFHFVIMVSISILIGCDCFANIKLTKLCYQLLVTCHTGVRHEILSPGSAAQRDSARPRAFQNSVTSLVSASVTEKKSGARRRRWRTWNLKP